MMLFRAINLTPVSSCHKKRAFTLIELLVVIAIIGVLSTLVIVSLGNSRVGARDAKRLNDLKAMANALELYYADNNSYPEAENFSPGATFEAGGVVYMGKVPNNPTPWTDGGCPNSDYTYTQVDSGQSYNISACLGVQAANSPSVGFTTVTYSPSGLFQCGQQINDLDGNIYNTVQIGTQCWMKESLNIGIKLASASDMPNNEAIIEKWCYNNLDSNCAIYGGLYAWDQAMNLPVICRTTSCVPPTPHQGICPQGWHIPTDEEFNILEQYTVAIINSNENQYSCNTSISSWQRCADNNGTNEGGVNGAGKSLKKSGVGNGNDLVGFSSLLAGFRTTSNSFTAISSRGDFWSFSQSNLGSAWPRYLVSSFSTVGRHSYPKGGGLAIRCLKD